MSLFLEAPASPQETAPPRLEAVPLDEIDAATVTIARMRKTIADLQAENERLREALAKLDDPKFRYAPFAVDAWFAPGMEDYDYDNAIAAVRDRQAEEDQKAKETADADAATRRRGDVFLAPIPFSNGLPGCTRPAVMVQTDNLGTGLDQVVVALITSNLDRATHPSRVFLALGTVQVGMLA